MTPEILAWLIFGVITVLTLIPTVINCIKRTWLQSVVRLGLFAVGLVLAIVLTGVFVNPAMDFVNAIPVENIERISDYLFSGSVAATTLLALLKALVAPLLFFVLYLAFELIMLIIYAVLSVTLLKKVAVKDNVKVLNRIVSVALNVALCFTFLSTFFLPVTYYADLADAVLEDPVVKEYVAGRG